MRIRVEIIPITLALLAIALPTALAQPPGSSFQSALPVDLIPGKLTIPESGYYLVNETSAENYFELRGLEGGMKLKITVEVIGVEQGRSMIALYTGSGSLIKQEKAIYGEETMRKIELTYQPSKESAGPGTSQYLGIKVYSGAMNYKIELQTERVDDYSPGEGDAGSDLETAITLPTITGNRSLTFTGYLASREDGDDYSDYYMLGAIFGDSSDVLRIRINPSHGLYISASLYKETYMLKQNSSRGAGDEIQLTLSGKWEKDEEYDFLLRVDNLEGKGGGSYEVEAWIESGSSRSQTATQTLLKPSGFEESTIRLAIIAGAAALIAISIAMLILRRRRIYRVEEVGWWGAGSW